VKHSTMAIPDIKISAFRLFKYGFNLFVRWHQRLRFKRWEVLARERVGVTWVKIGKIVFLGGSSYLLVHTLLLCIVQPQCTRHR